MKSALCPSWAPAQQDLPPLPPTTWLRLTFQSRVSTASLDDSQARSPWSMTAARPVVLDGPDDRAQESTPHNNPPLREPRAGRLPAVVERWLGRSPARLGSNWSCSAAQLTVRLRRRPEPARVVVRSPSSPQLACLSFGPLPRPSGRVVERHGIPAQVVASPTRLALCCRDTSRLGWSSTAVDRCPAAGSRGWSWPPEGRRTVSSAS
jgi:hypothetical protein